MFATGSVIRPGFYRLPEDPVGPSVFIPGFVSATSVRGAFGWFSAGWIGRLAPGLAEYISRDDVSPIDFTVAPFFYPAEREAAEQGLSMTPEEASRRVVVVFREGKADASALARHALDCLAWMIATGTLRLRIAVQLLSRTIIPSCGYLMTVQIRYWFEGRAMPRVGELPPVLNTSTWT